MKGRGRDRENEKDSYVTWQPMTEGAEKTEQRSTTVSTSVEAIKDPERGGR